MTVTIHRDVTQGSDEWYSIRRGRLTASEMHLIITPTLKIADNDKQRAHCYELLAQRITGYTEPQYVSDAMLRGKDDEVEAGILYTKHYAPVEYVGFITNDRWGFTLGYSPDGLVGKDGLIEAKSRMQKLQVQTLIEHGWNDTIPPDYMIQIQTGLLVSERPWCDFISYSGGLPMVTIRVLPDPVIQDAIIKAATAFEAKLAEKMDAYHKVLASKARLIPTERRIEQEMFI